MTDRAPIALMAAALFLALLVQPRSAQPFTLKEAADTVLARQGQPRSDQPPMEAAPAVECPCGDPREFIPDLGDWLGLVKCVGTKQFAGGVSLVSKSVGHAMDLGLFSHGVGYNEVNCLYFEDGGVAGKGQSGMSKAQSVACSRLIIDYAQELKDEAQVKIVDLGCNLK